MAEERVLGVLGGMGPLASAQFMLRLTLLTPAQRDQDHVPTVLWSDPRVPDRTLPLGVGSDPLPWLLRGVAGLRAAGCGAIVIPCNTAHRWHAEIASSAHCPVPHIVDAVLHDLARLGLRSGASLGLMATAATLGFELYQRRFATHGFACLVPDETEMRTQVTPAIAEVKANRQEAAFAPLVRSARRLIERGAQAIVLGCTEIPLGLAAGPQAEIGDIAFVDSIDALARTAIAWAHQLGNVTGT